MAAYRSAARINAQALPISVLSWALAASYYPAMAAAPATISTTFLLWGDAAQRPIPAHALPVRVIKARRISNTRVFLPSPSNLEVMRPHYGMAVIGGIHPSLRTSQANKIFHRLKCNHHF